MIALAADCLMFRLSNGECIPFSSDMIAIEMMGDAARVLDREFVLHAAKAVFYYFKQDLKRESVTAVEFAQALEFILQEFELKATQRSGRQVLQADLVQLAFESGKGCELFFFPRLREELRSQLKKEPRE